MSVLPAKKIGQLPADGKCSTCGDDLQANGRCDGCGAVYGEAFRCPHCRTIADLEESEVLRFRCRVCGGPRIAPIDSDIPRSGREKKALERAKVAHAHNTGWKFGAGLLGGLSVLSLLVTLGVLALTSPGLVATVIAILFTVAPAVLAYLAWARAKRARVETLDQVERAYTEVVRDIAKAKDGDVTARELADLLQIEEPDAELLLAHLSVDTFVRARVEEPAPRARLDDAQVAEQRELLEQELDAEEDAEAPATRARTRPPSA